MSDFEDSFLAAVARASELSVGQARRSKAPESPMPDTLGPFIIEDALGRGGMGVVYRARHRDTGLSAAIKTVRTSDPEHAAALRREIHALSEVGHPGVVKVLSQGQHTTGPWFAMELVEGTSLREVLSTGPDFDALLPTLRGICEALAFLHGEGIIHRDLKPENVLVRADGRPVLVDFGLTMRSFASDTSREVIAGHSAGGTPSYMAPEQISGGLIDARTDMYSLGCMLYEAALGKPPFEGQSTATILQSHVEREPVPLLQLTKVPSVYADTVMRLLAKRPGERLGYAEDVARILGELGASSPFGGVCEVKPYLFRPALAGREAQKRTLEALFDRRSTAVALIKGESGVGKTRLAMDVARWARRLGGWVLAGECQGGAVVGSGIHPLTAPLTALVDRCTERGEAEFHHLFGDGARILAPYAPTLATWCERTSMGPPERLPPELAMRRCLEALVRAFTRAARRSPLLLVLDDLQWADELTGSFVRRIASLEEAVPFVIITTARGDESTPTTEALWEGPITRIELSRLDRPSIAHMVGDMLALVDPPEPVVAFLASESEGNPFVAAEMLRAAVDEGLLTRDDQGRWLWVGSDKALSALSVPRSIVALVARQLEHLDQASLGLIQAASVVGRELDEALLAPVAGGADHTFLKALGDLLRRGLLDEPSPGRYRFAHARLRAHAYESLDETRRADLHRLAATGLVERGRPQDAPHIAMHWDQSGEHALARPAYLTSARMSVARIDNAEAERCYRRHIQLAPGVDPDSLDATLELCEAVLIVQGRHDESQGLLLDARRDAAALGLGAVEARISHALGEQARARGDNRRARALLRLALAHFEARGLNKGEIRARISLAITLQESGSYGAATEHLEEAIAQLSEHRDDQMLARALGSLAVIAHNQSRIDEALALHERARAIQTRARFLRGLAWTMTNIALCHQERARLDLAATINEEAIALHRKCGDRRGEARTLINAAVVMIFMGHCVEALARLSDALDILNAIGDQRSQSLALNISAGVHRLLEHHERAMGLYREALELRLASEDRLGAAETRAGIAAVFVEIGAHDEADEALEAALTIQRQLEDRWGEAESLWVKGRSLSARGRHPQALAVLTESLRLHDETDNRFGAGQVLTSLAQLHLDTEHMNEARTCIDKALDIAAQTGFRRLLALGLQQRARLRSLEGDAVAAQADEDAAQRHFDAMAGAQPL